MMIGITSAHDDLLRAALTGVFDPRALIPEGAAEADDRLAALATLAVERELNGNWYWALTPDAREAGLRQLPDDPAARDPILATVPRLTGDQLGAALRAALAAKPGPDLRALLDRGAAPGGAWTNAKGLDPNTLAQALEMLYEARVKLPDWAANPATARALRRAVVLDRRARAAHRLLPTPFRGRGRELRALEHYIRTGEATDQAVRPIVETVPDVDTAGHIRVVIVTGIGGTGKSALMEALRRRAEQADDVTFLNFDLDQTSLRSGERMALTMELLRQIGLLRPDLDQKLSAVRGHLRDALTGGPNVRGLNDRGLVEVSSSAVYFALSELGALLAAAGLKNHGFNLVFDTFEQAMVAGADRVRLIADWLMLLRSVAGMERLRVILAGREADLVSGLGVSGLAVVGRIALGDLGTNAGRAKLRDMFRAMGVPHLDLVPDLIGAFGSNPLVIQIVASFCRNRLRAEIEALAEDDDDDLRGELNTEMRQRILYLRILNRIAVRELRPLANLGLVLRRITPELIEFVLAEPCGLEPPLPPGKADALYEALSGQVWLVRPSPAGNALEHVPDLRRVMLPQILALPDAVKVAHAAAEWYERAAAGIDGPDLWESLYYRALNEPEALDGCDGVDLLAVADHLGAAVRDLPQRAQAMLREASGAILTREEISALSGDARNRATRKRRNRQVSEGLEQTILDEAPASEFDGLLSQDFGAGGATDAVVMDPAIVRSAFGLGEFDRLAAAASALVLALLLEVADDRVSETQAYDLTHPAWLAAIATLDPDVPIKYRDNLRESVEGWASSPRGREGARALLGILNGGGNFERARTRVTLLVLGLAAAPEAPLWPLEQALATRIPLPALTGTVETALDWRFKAMIGLREPVAPRQPDMYSLPVGEVPVLNPALSHERINFALSSGPNGKSESAEKWFGPFSAAQPMKLSELSRALNGLDRLQLDLDPHRLTAEARAALIPGRLPEFHAPLRLLLDDTDPSPELASAVASVTGRLPWWPVEVSPDLFARDTLGPTLIGTLIDLLDRAGMLPELARALAEKDGSNSRAARIAGLIDAFAGVLRGI